MNGIKSEMRGFACETNVPVCPPHVAHKGVAGGCGGVPMDDSTEVAVVAAIWMAEGIGVVHRTDAGKAKETGAMFGTGA